MSERNDGGLAFPGTRMETVYQWDDLEGAAKPRDQEVEHPGMSIRDYFAAKAMQAELIAGRVEHCCKRSYQLADAMLAEREE